MKGTPAGPGARLLWSLLRRNRPSVPLGAGRGDLVLLQDSPALAHLARAILGAEARTALSLLTEPVDFIAAPDPSELLRRTCAGNPPAATGAVPLRVLCWNLALLDVHIGPWTYRRSPWVEERREPVLRRVVEDGADIVLLQELWHARDQARLAELAPGGGYRLVCPPRPHVDGLAVLVREELIAGPVEVELRPYGVQDRLEALELPGKETFLRSWLRCTFDHPVLGRLSVFDTHLSAYPPAWRRRLHQCRSLGQVLADRPPGELVLAGGDLNCAWSYGRQSWRLPNGTLDGYWWHNALSLPLLHHYGGLVDLAIRGRSPADATAEVALGRRLPNDPKAAVASVPAVDHAHRQAYTATDGNALYWRQYAGTEQPARLDHVLARDPDGRVHVAASRHRFTERELELDRERVELSDHYAVEVELQVG